MTSSLFLLVYVRLSGGRVLLTRPLILWSSKTVLPPDGWHFVDDQSESLRHALFSLSSGAHDRLPVRLYLSNAVPL